VLIAAETNAPNLYFRAFFDDESDANGVGRDGTDFGADGSELVAVFGEQLLQHDLSLLHLGGIVLVFDRKRNLALLEAIEHVAGRNCIQTDIVDLADRGPFFDVNVKDPTLGILFPLKANVFKIASVPERVEVTLDGRRVIHVADFGEDAGFDRVGRYTAIAVGLNADNELLLAENRGRQ